MNFQNDFIPRMALRLKGGLDMSSQRSRKSFFFNDAAIAPASRITLKQCCNVGQCERRPIHRLSHSSPLMSRLHARWNKAMWHPKAINSADTMRRKRDSGMDFNTRSPPIVPMRTPIDPNTISS